MKLHSAFIGTIAAITLFGLMMVASASSFYAQRTFGTSLYFFYQQLFQGILVGGIGFLAAYVIPFRILKKFALPIFFIAVASLLLVFVPGLGIESGGANRWARVAGISFQPSEFAKIGLIFYLASWLASHKEELSHFYRGFLPILLASGLVPFLILLEPNVSNFGITSILILILLFVGGARIKHVVLFLLMMGVIGLTSVLLLPSRLERVQTLLNPAQDPAGASYQLRQSLIALGSGGITGKGLFMSTQKEGALPEVYGDAIFAIIGEEFGFVGSIVLVVVYFIILGLGILIIRASSDPFAQYFTIGFVSLVTMQAFINIGAISGLLPLTGVTLPFVSYGSSSLTSLLLASGLVAQFAREASLTSTKARSKVLTASGSYSQSKVLKKSGS